MMLDCVDTVAYMSPPALEYFDPLPGEMVGSVTVRRIVTQAAKSATTAFAAASSTSKVLQVEVADSPELSALQRLRQFKTFEANWDAEHAAAPDHAAIDAATTILSLLSAKGVTPKVSLTSDGHPMFLFGNEAVQGEIVVTSATTLDYFFDSSEGDGDCDVAFDGRHIPEAVLQFI